MSAPAKRNVRGKLVDHPAIRERLRAAVMRDEPIITLVQESGMSDRCLYTSVRRLGFRRMYVTDQERAEIMKRRLSASTEGGAS